MPGGGAGLAPRLVADLTAQVIDEFDIALSASSIPPSSRRAYRARFASLRQLLYETRVVDAEPTRRRSARGLEQRFAEVAMAAPVRQPCRAAYECVRRCCRPSRWNRWSTSCCRSPNTSPRITAADQPARAGRACLAGYLAWYRARGLPGHRAAAGAGRSVSTAVAQSAVLSLRNLLDDITAWGWEQAPPQRLVFAADVPNLTTAAPRTTPASMRR